MAFETVFGENHTLTFVSMRPNMAAIETGMERFAKAMRASFGANFESVYREADACLIGSRTELRKRRWDLSPNPPRSEEDHAKYVGGARWVHTTALRIRPGRAMEFEELAKTVKGVMEKGYPNTITMISEPVAGQEGTTYYVTSLHSTMAELDGRMLRFKEALGPEGHARFLKTMSDILEKSEVMIGRFRPEFSNPPESVVNVTRDFWAPKTKQTGTADRMKKK
jgi:hypothetical protein